MLIYLKSCIQYILPKRLISRWAGKIADSKINWFKNFLISRFIYLYRVNLADAEYSDPTAYPTFNAFFTRRLKPGARPQPDAGNIIVAPGDGQISGFGKIQANQILQVKQQFYTLESLLGADNTWAEKFYDGNYLTLYLAPHNYHRVHMPIAGRLLYHQLIGGCLFSVNRMASTIIPQLYCRNERTINIFATTTGYMAVILVGALIVGSIQQIWYPQTMPPPDLYLGCNQELGLFKLGSTVIVLFSKDAMSWLEELTLEQTIIVGQKIGMQR